MTTPIPFDPIDADAPVRLALELPAHEAWELMHHLRGLTWAETFRTAMRDEQAHALLQAAGKVAAELHAIRAARRGA